jgi:hypothetical protein
MPLSMKNAVFTLLICLTYLAIICEARIANPYPVAIIRQGDIYLIESKDKIERLTELGDVKELCWLNQETICFSRCMETGLTENKKWRGFKRIWDLFIINRNGGAIQQFTANHFARGPAPSPIGNRALFWHDNRSLGTLCEIWESIHPLRRDRPLGIRGISPDSAPNQRWTAASLGNGEAEGIGLYRYPTNDAYKKLRGPYHRPRFLPDSQILAYINEESGEPEIWGYEIPDGEPEKLLDSGDNMGRIIDFGWVRDGSGYILLLEDKDSTMDVYYWEIKKAKLHKLTKSGDIQAATSWH